MDPNKTTEAKPAAAEETQANANEDQQPVSDSHTVTEKSRDQTPAKGASATPSETAPVPGAQAQDPNAAAEAAKDNLGGLLDELRKHGFDPEEGDEEDKAEDAAGTGQKASAKKQKQSTLAVAEAPPTFGHISARNTQQQSAQASPVKKVNPKKVVPQRQSTLPYGN